MSLLLSSTQTTEDVFMCIALNATSHQVFYFLGATCSRFWQYATKEENKMQVLLTFSDVVTHRLQIEYPYETGTRQWVDLSEELPVMSSVYSKRCRVYAHIDSRLVGADLETIAKDNYHGWRPKEYGSPVFILWKEITPHPLPLHQISGANGLCFPKALLEVQVNSKEQCHELCKEMGKLHDLTPSSNRGRTSTLVFPLPVGTNGDSDPSLSFCLLANMGHHWSKFDQRYKLIFKLVNDKYILFESVEPTEEDIIFISTCSTDEYPTMSEYL